MELRGEQRPALIAGHEMAAAVIAERHFLLGVAEVDVETASNPRARGESGVGVHEIEPFALHAIEQHGAFGGIDGIPAYVGHHVGIESAHLAVNELQPRRVKVMLGARVNMICSPTHTPSTGRPARRRS